MDQISPEEYEEIWPWEQEYDAWMQALERDFWAEFKLVGTNVDVVKIQQKIAQNVVDQ